MSSVEFLTLICTKIPCFILVDWGTIYYWLSYLAVSLSCRMCKQCALFESWSVLIYVGKTYFQSIHSIPNPKKFRLRLMSFFLAEKDARLVILVMEAGNARLNFRPQNLMTYFRFWGLCDSDLINLIDRHSKKQNSWYFIPQIAQK